MRTVLRPDRKSGLAGFPESLTLDDPDGVLGQDPDCRSYWVRPQPDADADPLKWRYAVVKAAEGTRGEAKDLLPLLSPLLAVTTANRRPTKSQAFWFNQAGGELDERGAWMRAGWNAAAAVVVAAARNGLELRAAPYRKLVQYLSDMAVGVNRVPPARNSQNPIRERVRAMVRRSLLNELAEPDIIDLLVPGGDSIRDLDAQLASDLATTAIGAFPGEPARIWLFGNLPRLRRIARMPAHMRIRGPANAILHLFDGGPEPGADPETQSLAKLPAEDTLTGFAAALMCVATDGLANLFEKHIGSWDLASEAVGLPHLADRHRRRRLVEGGTRPRALDESTLTAGGNGPQRLA